MQYYNTAGLLIFAKKLNYFSVRIISPSLYNFIHNSTIFNVIHSLIPPFLVYFGQDLNQLNA